MKKRIKWIDIIIIILFILAVYFILTKIFGHSASDLSIILTLFSLLVSIIVKTDSNLNREFVEFKIKSVNSFDKVRGDINLIKKKLKI